MTKDSVLAELLKAGGCVSGEEISGGLGVSRAAVNAAVQALRADGYEISASTRTGYELLRSPDRICAGELAARLGAERMESVVCLDSVDSTNDRAKLLAQSGAPDGTAVAANGQTAGRGRMGRRFQSPDGEGVYLSMLLRPEIPPEDAAQLTAWTSVAMCRAVERTCGVRPGIKWVNDLVLNRRKLGGILTELTVEGESRQIGSIVVGVGINVNQTAFSLELAPIAASLSTETGASVSRCALTAEMIRALDGIRASFPAQKDDYLRAYRENCVTLGREISFTRRGETLFGFAEDIDDDFGLVVRRPDGSRETLRSGETSVRGLYGYV